jgi:hypothetical protein
MEHTLSLDPSPGTGLFMPGLWAAAGGEESSLLAVGERHRRLVAATSLPIGAVACPLWASCAIPLVGPERARVIPVDDSLIGHPLFWMPQRLLGRFELVSSDGTTQQEGQDVWVARVLLEAIAAGWYERSTGKWIDVLSEADREPDHVRSWMTGVLEDPVLDTLEAPVSADAQWAIEAAQGLVGHLRSASDALAAAEIAAAVRSGDPEMVRSGALAAGVIGVVDGAGCHPFGGWERLASAPDDTELVASALDRLDELREAGEESLEQLAQVFLGPGGIDS